MQPIFQRAREILTSPAETWRVIKTETQTVQELFINYAAPLALIPALAMLIGLSIVGVKIPAGTVARAPFFEALAGGVVGYIFHLLGLLGGGWVVNFLAPYFDSRQNFNAALKLVIYSMTPVWLVGIFSALPGLGVLQLFGLYGLYLLYLGLPALMETPPAKVLWYAVLIVISAVLISLIMTIFVGGAVYGPMYMRLMAG